VAGSTRIARAPADHSPRSYAAFASFAACLLLYAVPPAPLERQIDYYSSDSIGRSAIECVQRLVHGARLHRKVWEQCGGPSMT